jgi:hypothetical protein
MPMVGTHTKANTHAGVALKATPAAHWECLGRCSSQYQHQQCQHQQLSITNLQLLPKGLVNTQLLMYG